MDTFKDRVSNEPKQISWLSIVLVAVLLALLFWVVYQFKDQHRFAFVKMHTKENTINQSKNYGFAPFPSNERNYGAVLAEKGACMGSGWLLLLVPAVLLFSLVFPRKLLKKSFKKVKKNEPF
jgi:nitrogen fixation-related uncharacterized protein